MKPREFKRFVLQTIDSEYDKDARNKFTQKTSFAPSAFYSNGRCARRWYLSFNGEDWQDFSSPRSRRVMENGTDRHARIQERLKPIAHEIEEEVFHEDPPIHGFIDVTIKDGEDIIPGEIKTSIGAGFVSKTMKNRAAPYQEVQLIIYCKIKNTKRGFFLFENNDDKELAVILFGMTPEREEYGEYLFNWMREVYDAYEKNLLPEDNFRSNSAVCKECPVRRVCKETLGKEGDINIEPLVLPK